jgi:hypothetical protein
VVTWDGFANVKLEEKGLVNCRNVVTVSRVGVPEGVCGLVGEQSLARVVPV